MRGNISKIGKFKRFHQRPTQEHQNVTKIDLGLVTGFIGKMKTVNLGHMWDDTIIYQDGIILPLSWI